MEKKFNVMIIENKTGKIEAVIGKNMSEDRADRREMTGLSRINKDFHISVEEVI